jgi:hypothetical protein
MVRLMCIKRSVTLALFSCLGVLPNSGVALTCTTLGNTRKLSRYWKRNSGPVLQPSRPRSVQKLERAENNANGGSLLR